MDARRGTRVSILAVLGLLGLVAAVQGVLLYRALHPSDLEAWVAHVQRPGQRLLYKAETSGHYFAVFDAGGGRISFCVKDLQSGKGITASSTSVLDEQGKDLELSSEPLLETHRLFLTARYVESQGMILSLRPGYQGSIHVIYREGTLPTPPDGSRIPGAEAGPVLLDAVLRR